MNKKVWIWIALALFAAGIWTAQKLTVKTVSPESHSSAPVKSKGYWTCPMHPQIHAEKAGECPICHMNLVFVDKQVDTRISEEDSRSSILAGAHQLELAGAGKLTVEKMTLSLRVPVSGRLISPKSVAFQVYESDMRYIKPGLIFSGQSTVVSEGEISGVITSVDSTVDPTSRTVRVVGSIRKSPPGLVSETTFSGVIEVSLGDRLAIPEMSVLHTGTGDLVYAVDGNKLTPKKVVLGLKTESFYEVLSGLSAGDVISSGPNFLLDSEAKIRGTHD